MGGFDLFVKWHLPLMLVTVVVLGYLVPEPGIEAGKTPLTTICIIVIFAISGVRLKTDEVKRALKSPFPFAYGVVAILFVTPLLGYVCLLLGPAITSDFAIGLAVFAIMPTTISSGAIITKEVRRGASCCRACARSGGKLAARRPARGTACPCDAGR